MTTRKELTAEQHWTLGHLLQDLEPVLSVVRRDLLAGYPVSHKVNRTMERLEKLHFDLRHALETASFEDLGDDASLAMYWSSERCEAPDHLSDITFSHHQ